MKSSIIEEVKERVPLRPVLDAYLGQPIRDRYRCAFHPSEDVHPSLKITPDGQNYKCWSCPAKGTVIDLVMFFEGIAKPYDAAKFLAEKYLGANPPDWPATPTRPTLQPKPARTKPGHWRNPVWQEAANDLVILGERHLSSSVGGPARAWLAGQGINMLTARRRRLGFFPEDNNSPVLDMPIGKDGKPGSIWVPRGLTIPWCAPGAWYSAGDPPPGPRWVGVNIRRFGPDVFAEKLPDYIRSKYKTFEGSERGHGYPFPDLARSQVGPPAMIFEGEKDAMLAEQEAGHLIHAFSFGGASQTEIEPTTLAALACCPWWLVAGDYDEPGVEAAERWLRMANGKGLRPNLPFAKDLCDFASKGGDVRAWIEAELAQRNLIGPFIAKGPRSSNQAKRRETHRPS